MKLYHDLCAYRRAAHDGVVTNYEMNESTETRAS